MKPIKTMTIKGSKDKRTLQIRPSFVKGEEGQVMLIMFGPRNGWLSGMSFDPEVLREGLQEAGLGANVGRLRKMLQDTIVALQDDDLDQPLLAGLLQQMLDQGAS